MQQLPLFVGDLLTDPKGEARREEGKVYQAIPALERTEPIVADLMEQVVRRENLIRAWKRVRAKKGSPGIDGMTVDDLTGYLKEGTAADSGRVAERRIPPPAGERGCDSEGG